MIFFSLFLEGEPVGIAHGRNCTGNFPGFSGALPASLHSCRFPLSRPLDGAGKSQESMDDKNHGLGLKGPRVPTPFHYPGIHKGGKGDPSPLENMGSFPDFHLHKFRFLSCCMETEKGIKSINEMLIKFDLLSFFPPCGSPPPWPGWGFFFSDS